MNAGHCVKRRHHGGENAAAFLREMALEVGEAIFTWFDTRYREVNTGADGGQRGLSSDGGLEGTPGTSRDCV